jgi:4-hydroxythreonine-4-phosphate dehydrogenase
MDNPSEKERQERVERTDKDRKVIVGITHGDFNGIGYEVIIKTFMDPRMLEICTPVVYGSSKIASYHRKVLDVNDFNFNLIRNTENVPVKRANIVNIHDQEVKVEIGESSEVAGKLALTALNFAVDDLKSGRINALVTAPINKKNIQSPSFDFKGHTEYLAQKFNSQNYMMLMVSDKIRIGFVTGHLAISDINKALSSDIIYNKIVTMNQSLIRDFGIRKPKIAVLGLNPHGGDNGLMGNEENEVIRPAINRAAAENILAFGPYPSDGFFAANSYKDFDGILAMYHDQGMIAFKILSFDYGVNFTAGLPYVRTSPAHGTAYDIAGKNVANPESFRQAIYLAVDIWTQRQKYAQLNANPLKIKASSNEERET